MGIRHDERDIDLVGSDAGSPVWRWLRGSSTMLPNMFDELLVANRAYAPGFSLQGIPPGAAKAFALVTCMDSRIEPLTMLGLHPGDAKILRNAGGRVTDDVIRSLILATAFLDVSEIAVMQHTDCALAYRTDADIGADLRAMRAMRAEGWEGRDFLAMPDPDRSLQSDVDALRSCELLPARTRVEGWRYDVETGLIERVIAS
jgi:carbonic anhydrase